MYKVRATHHEGHLRWPIHDYTNVYDKTKKKRKVTVFELHVFELQFSMLYSEEQERNGFYGGDNHMQIS